MVPHPEVVVIATAATRSRTELRSLGRVGTGAVYVAAVVRDRCTKVGRAKVPHAVEHLGSTAPLGA